MKKLFFAIALLATLFTIQACSEAEYNAFKTGWNSTAPSEYHLY